MTLPLPPPIPDDDDARCPDECNAWTKLRRIVSAVLADAPALRLSVGSAQGTDVRAELARVRGAGRTRLQPRTQVVKVDGYERASLPGRVWCAEARLSLDDGAGARLVHSEVGDLLARGYSQYALAVGLATINEAVYRYGRAADAVFRLVTGDTRAQHRGWFGRQGGRWAASLQDPTMRALAAWRIARELYDTTRDFTRGARRWDDGYTQDRLAAAGRVRYDALGIVRKWCAEGWSWIGPVFEYDAQTPLIDPYRLLLFRFVGRGHADLWLAEQAVKDGRKRWGIRR